MGARGSAFASDFDGTLCESNWETGEIRFAEENIEAVRRYQAEGGLFGVCTGRPLFAVQKDIEGIIDLDFYIVSTGAQVIGPGGVTLWERSIEMELVEDVYERFGMADDVVLLVLNEESFMSVGKEMRPEVPVVDSVRDVPGRLLGVSLEFRGDEEEAARAVCALNERYAGRLEGFQNLSSVDIVRAGCSKGSGVRVAKEGLSVSRIAGIGDSYNDLTLLEAADVSYTFHASPDIVRAVADKVVSSVAQALKDFCS